MTKSIDFYFDFISPYSYLAYKKLSKLNIDSKIIINYKPILLGGLHNLEGISPPAFNKHKMINMKNDCELVALKNKIEFIWNSKFPINSLYLMRGYITVKNEIKKVFLDSCFDAYWKKNLDIADEKNINEILQKVDLNINEFFENIQNPKIKDKLKEFTQEAFDKNIFGAPTFVVNDKIFWGQDRLDYALDEYNS